MIASAPYDTQTGSQVTYAGAAADTSQSSLRLLSSGDGWALVRRDGKLVYSALGIAGRRRCLEFAHAEGVVTLTS